MSKKNDPGGIARRGHACFELGYSFVSLSLNTGTIWSG